MARPKKTPENSGLMPWSEVARRIGISQKQARLEGARALQKLREACEEAGLDEEFIRGLAHDRESEESKHGDALAALTAVRYGDADFE